MRLGSDPEVFLMDSKKNPISSIGYIKADKWAPLQIPNMSEGFTLQEDNVTLEYGIPPAATENEFVNHIQAVMEKSKEYIPGLTFSKLSCIIFPKSQLQHPSARTFGCEPDFNIWTKKENPKPQPPHPNMRSAGGHIHVETQLDPSIGIKAMDMCLAVPSVFMDINGGKRRQLYGKAGAYRPKPYGFEYRTLSNFWIFEEKLIRWVWRNTVKALEIGDVSKEKEAIEAAVNNGHKRAAAMLVKKYDLEVLV